MDVSSAYRLRINNARKQIIVADHDFAQRFREPHGLWLGQVKDRGNMAFIGQNLALVSRVSDVMSSVHTHDFERPGGPPRDDGDPAVLLIEHDDAFRLSYFLCGIVAQQAGVARSTVLPVGFQMSEFCSRLLRYAGRNQRLPVG